jgi:protein-tyrosine phosphatase
MAESQEPIGVNFVCLGNICRSPMAEAIFQKLVDEAGLSESFWVASSAVGTWHLGERPHPGTQAVLKQNQVPLNPDKRAMQLSASDFTRYRYILALDQEISSSIQHTFGHKVLRLMEFAPEGFPLDVVDPYYSHNFTLVYELVRAACQGLLEHIRRAEGI